MTSEALVHASGGIVADDDGRVLLVHRPKYDDWSWPKGKLDPGETDEQCAVREVEEETGLRCALGDEVLPTFYRDPKRRPKVVRYWVMTPVHVGAFTANDEIDDLRWVTKEEAVELLSYERDVDVLNSFLDRR